MTFSGSEEKALWLKQVSNKDPDGKPFWATKLVPGHHAIGRSFNPPRDEPRRFVGGSV